MYGADVALGHISVVAAKYLAPDMLLDTFSRVEAYRAGIALVIDIVNQMLSKAFEISLFLPYKGEAYRLQGNWSLNLSAASTSFMNDHISSTFRYY